MVVGKNWAAEVPTDLNATLEATDLMVILNRKSEMESGRSYDELAHAINENCS